MYNSIVCCKVLTHLPAGDGKLKALLRQTPNKKKALGELSTKGFLLLLTLFRSVPRHRQVGAGKAATKTFCQSDTP